MKIPSLILLAAAGLTAASSADVVSDFSTDTEGWRVVSLPDNGPYGVPQQTSGVTYGAAGGNPGGFISSGDPDAVTFWFDAPGKFLGNRGSSFGNSLSFDLLFDASPTQTPWEDADVALIGAGMVLVADVGPNPPLGSWIGYSIGLSEAAGWRLDGLAGGVPTQAEFQAVLGDLQALRIRGEFVFGAEFTGLDNVRLGAPAVVPESSTTGLVCGAAALGLAGWAGVRRRR